MKGATSRLLVILVRRACLDHLKSLNSSEVTRRQIVATNRESLLPTDEEQDVA